MKSNYLSAITAFFMVSCQPAKMQVNGFNGSVGALDETLPSSSEAGSSDVKSTMPTQTPTPSPSANTDQFDLFASFKMPVSSVMETDLVKLVVIVDDSSSMSDKQERLALAIKNALTQFRGREIEVLLYSTTQVGAPTTDIPQRPATVPTLGLFGNYTGLYATSENSKLDGMYFGSHVANPGTSGNNSKLPFLRRISEVRSNGVYTPMDYSKYFSGDGIRETFVAGPSGFSGTKSVRFFRDMTDGEFQSALNKIYTEVKIGDQGTSDAELPLCTLASLLMNEGPNKIFNSGDKTAFLILTDEDQSNLSCIYQYQSEVKPISDRVAKPSYIYDVATYKYFLKCDISGTDSWCPTNAYKVYSPFCLNAQGVSICIPEGPAKACSQSTLDSWTSELRSSLAAQITAGTARLPTTQEAFCSMNSRVPNPNFGLPHREVTSIFVGANTTCDAPSFSMKNATGEFVTVNKSLRQYFRDAYPLMDVKNCDFSFSSHQTISHRFIDFPGVTTKDTLRSFIRNKADQLFGSQNYMISLIGNMGAKNPPGCSAYASAESKEIIALTGDSHAYSICSSDYTPAMKWFDSFARYKAGLDYKVSTPITSLKGIILWKADGRKIVLSESDYSFSPDAMLRISNKEVAIGDTIDIRYE